MEDLKTVIIPTGTKAKISHKLSFPIGAKRISMALAPVAQLPQLVLHFRSDRFNQVRFGHYPFLRVVYSRAEKLSDPIPSALIPLFNEWQITLWPVPRVFRHHIQQYIIDSALPQIKQWLDQRVNLVQPGSDSLTFFFDEDKEEFIPEQLARLQPARRVEAEGMKAIGMKSPPAKHKKEQPRP